MDQNPAVPLIGAWELISFEIQADDGKTIHPFGENAQGSIIYTDSGRFSAQVMRPDRPRFATEDQMKGTPQEIKDSFQGVISYYGSYDFDQEAGFVVHHVERSLFPNWEGSDQKRYVELAENQLTLSTPPTLWGGGGEVVGVLVWSRME